MNGSHRLMWMMMMMKLIYVDDDDDHRDDNDDDLIGIFSHNYINLVKFFWFVFS